MFTHIFGQTKSRVRRHRLCLDKRFRDSKRNTRRRRRRRYSFNSIATVVGGDSKEVVDSRAEFAFSQYFSAMFAWWCALLGTAVLLTWAHAISSWPHGQDVRHFKALELLKFVMTHDDNWRPVLDRKIRVTEDFGRPPYHEEGADDTPVSWALFAPGQTEIDVVPLVQTVLRHYWWLGSYVLYAEYAVNTSFMCTTFENVSLQMFLLLMLDHKFRHDVEGKDKAVKMELAKKSLLTKALFHDGWSTLALFMDKLAATLSHLKMMADVEYEFSDIRSGRRRSFIRLVFRYF